MSSKRKVQTEQQRAKKRSRASRKGWKTRKKNLRERREIERLTRENKELRDALEAQKDERQVRETVRKEEIIGLIKKKTIEEAPLRDLMRIALEEGFLTHDEVKTMTLREQLLEYNDEDRAVLVKETVQRRMDRARRIYGDTLLEAYLLVDMFEEFGYDSIDKIYDLWESDPEMAA